MKGKMELNFDKEIDALLRQAANPDAPGAANGSSAGAHIDADAISAFAENALPEKSRALYMTHLADCDRCRQILSNLVVLNAGTEISASASVAEGIAIAPIPWYRKLFVFPQLAYTMGALVLMFSGVLGFLVIQNMQNGSNEVSQTKEPSAVAPAPVNYGKTESAANTAIATNNNSVSVVPGSPGFSGQNTDNIPSEQQGLSVEKEKADSTKAGNVAPEAESTADITVRDGISRAREAKDEDKNADDTKNAQEVTAAQPAPPPPPVTSTAPAAAPPKPALRKSMPYGGVPADSTARAESGPDNSAERKYVGGKSFRRSAGIWVDSAYSNQPTKNVNRGTDEFRRLDSGLKNIANSLPGTVVVVWKSTAYKIQ